MTRRSTLLLCLGLAALAGCGEAFRRAPATPAAAPPPVASPAPRPPARALGTAGARSADALDTTTAAERAAATRAPAGGQELGQVVVSLGSPAEPGFWLRSSLVSQPRPGTVRTAGGESVQVELRPGSGAAQLSLSAFRALNLPLTGLPRVTVLGQ